MTKPALSRDDIAALDAEAAQRRNAWNAKHMAAIDAVLNDPEFVARLKVIDDAARELVGGSGTAILNIGRQIEQVRRLTKAAADAAARS